MLTIEDTNIILLIFVTRHLTTKKSENIQATTDLFLNDAKYKPNMFIRYWVVVLQNVKIA